MPGTASGRVQGPQEPHQFPATGAAGTRFQRNPEDISISAAKMEKQALKILLKIPHIFFTQRRFGLREFSKGNKLLDVENRRMQNVFGWSLSSLYNCSCCCLSAKQGKREKQEEWKESLNDSE